MVKEESGTGKFLHWHFSNIIVSDFSNYANDYGDGVKGTDAKRIKKQKQEQ
jgi:1,4-dihydroxy-2-naphthoate octaprenyltransferase